MRSSKIAPKSSSEPFARPACGRVYISSGMAVSTHAVACVGRVQRRASTSAAAAQALSARRAAAAAPLLLRCPPRGVSRASCAVLAADSAVCPVPAPGSSVHVTEPPSGLPSLATRPTSEVIVSSSKALEAFRATGAANRECPIHYVYLLLPARRAHAAHARRSPRQATPQSRRAA